MRTSLTCLSALVLLPSLAEAQFSILYTGRFPFVSVDAVNERPGGPISQMSEYDFSYSIPVPGSAIGRPLLPATAMHSYLGDGDLNGDFLKLRTWKPSYFTNIGTSVFVKYGVVSPTWEDVYFTVRLDPAAAGPFEVLTSGGTPVQLAAGDWVRFRPNGNAEFFLTAAELLIALGPQPAVSNPGASALVQAANGDLYFSPADGGCRVNGNLAGPFFANDGAICKIDAANITYDANGNVAALAANSARLLIEEATGGPGGTLTVRQMVLNSGAQDRTGMPIVVAGIYGKTGGLGLDPTYSNFPTESWTPTFPDAAGNFPPEPNLVFCSNAGSYGGTIWSTNNQGEVALVNGALCGSITPGVPADGAWLGVELDVVNFQPTLLGMTITGIPQQQLVADMNDYGSLGDNTTQPVWDVDFFGAPNQLVAAFLTIGPAAPSVVVPSVPPAITGLAFDPLTWPDLFHTTPPLVPMGFGLSNLFGYTTISTANPNPGGGLFTGVTIMVQGVGFTPAGLQLSSPLLVQLQ